MTTVWDQAYATEEGLRWWPEGDLVQFLGRTYGPCWPLYVRAIGLRAGEIGCGNGRNLLALFAWGFAFCGVDRSPLALGLAEQLLDERHPGLGSTVDLRRCVLPELLPWPTESLDLVIDCQTLQHLPDEVRPDALAEVARVLKPGGRFWSMHYKEGDAAQVYAGRYPELRPTTFAELAAQMPKELENQSVELTMRTYRNGRQRIFWLVTDWRKS